MAEIPPEIPSSAAQAGFQAREVAKERDARRTARVEATKRQAQAVDEAGRTVETTDNDVAVFSDSEGAGSQGKPFEDEKPAEEETEDTSGESGITRDDEGNYHLDLEA